MKKVLIGLVIAVMMTGNGYADFTNEDCSFFKKQAETQAQYAKDNHELIRTEAERQAKEGINKVNIIKHFIEKEYKHIKRAHYYAVTWSALCD